MDSNITINIVEPGSTPINAGTGTVAVPDTGLFTGGIGSTEATILGIAAVAILAIIIAAIIYYHKKHGKLISLKHKKATTIALTSLATVVSLGTIAGLLKLGASAVDDSLTLTVSSADLTIEVGDEPVFAILPVELTVKEATQAGYTLTAYAEDTNLVSTTDSSKVIPMVTLPEPLELNEEGVGRGYSPVTTLTDNTYGLSLVEPEDKDSELYAPLSTDIANPTLITNKDYKATAAEDTTTIYYGFYITPDVPYGTYTGSTINYIAQPNYITNLSFNGNGSDGGEEIADTTILAGDTITLPQNTFTKEGYHFTEWNTEADGEGTSYADESEFTASPTESEDIILYAQWEEDILYMQDVAKWGSTLSEGDTIEAVDNRDNKTYYVSRLADGNIWMTQNLDLDLSTETALTPANTNISANWTPANSTVAFTGTTVDGWQNDDSVPYSADPGELYVYSSGTTSNDDQYTSLEDCKAAHPDCSMHNHVGNYYNWSAAVANNDTSSITTQYTNVDTDICPAGWELPDGKQSSEEPLENNQLGTLIDSYGILGSVGCGGACYNYTEGGFNAIRTAPLWLARSGGVFGASLNGTGGSGFYWSSTVYYSGGAYYLNFYSGYVHPTDNNGRGHGYSVRCLAQ